MLKITASESHCNAQMAVSL